MSSKAWRGDFSSQLSLWEKAREEALAGMEQVISRYEGVLPSDWLESERLTAQTARNTEATMERMHGA